MERYIQVEDVIANAKTIVPDADDKALNIFKQWVYLGVKEIGPALEDVRTEELFPHDNSFLKPGDLLIVDDIALYDASGGEYMYTYRGPGLRVHQATNPLNAMPIDISEDDYYIHMGTNGEHVTKAVIRYYALPIDEDGQIKIKQDYLLALMFFIKFMWDVSHNRDTSDSFQKWRHFRAQARATNRRVTPMQAKAIGKRFNSMINKIFYERF